MGEEQATSVLRRKAAAGRVSVAAQRQITPCKALGQAVVQATDKRLDLAAAVTGCTMRTGTLAELLDTLPEGGLFAVLDGPAEALGLMVLDPAALSAVIEMTMTGRLAPRAPQPRRPTRTDAALTADLIDEILRRFEAPFEGTTPARWLAGFGYATFLDEARPLGLMLEDVDYRILSVQADLEKGRRSCGLMLALPAEGRGGLAPGAGVGRRAPAGASSASGPTEAAVSGAADEAAAPPWEETIAAGVMAGRVTLDSRLYRFSLPIAALGSLAPGLELPIPADALDEAEIVAADGRCVVRGRLGQVGGHRAIRLHGAPARAAGPGAGAGRADAAGSAGEVAADGEAGQVAEDVPAPGMALPALPGLAAPVPAAPEADAPLPADDDPLAGLPMPDFPDLPDLPDLDAPGDADAAPGSDFPDLPDLPDLPPLDGS